MEGMKEGRNERTNKRRKEGRIQKRNQGETKWRNIKATGGKQREMCSKNGGMERRKESKIDRRKRRNGEKKTI